MSSLPSHLFIIHSGGAITISPQAKSSSANKDHVVYYKKVCGKSPDSPEIYKCRLVGGVDDCVSISSFAVLLIFGRPQIFIINICSCFLADQNESLAQSADYLKITRNVLTLSLSPHDL